MSGVASYRANDEDGNPVDGIWAEEGGLMLRVKRDLRTGFVRFDVVSPDGDVKAGVTLASFRTKRVADLCLGDNFEASR